MHDGVADIDDGVRTLLVQRLGVETGFDEHAELRDLGLDSAALLSLVVGLEEAFDIEIPDREITIEHFATMRSIGTYVATRVAS